MNEATYFCRIVHFAPVEREGWIIIKIFEWKVFLHDYFRQCTNSFFISNKGKFHIICCE